MTVLTCREGWEFEKFVWTDRVRECELDVHRSMNPISGGKKSNESMETYMARNRAGQDLALARLKYAQAMLEEVNDALTGEGKAAQPAAPDPAKSALAACEPEILSLLVVLQGKIRAGMYNWEATDMCESINVLVKKLKGLA